MNLKYGIMIFNRDDDYKSFYKKLLERLPTKKDNKEIYFTKSNPINSSFNYSNNKFYICIKNENILFENIIKFIENVIENIKNEFNLLEISVEMAEYDEYKDTIFNFNYVLIINNNIYNISHYFINNPDKWQKFFYREYFNEYYPAIKFTINKNRYFGIMMLDVDNDIWEVKKLLLKFLPKKNDHFNFNKKNPTSNLLKYRFDNVLYAVSNYDDIFKHTCFLIEHICSKVFNEYPYLPANPIKDNEYSHVRISFITYDGIYNKEIYTKLDWDRFNNDGWNKDKTYKKILCERNLL